MSNQVSPSRNGSPPSSQPNANSEDNEADTPDDTIMREAMRKSPFGDRIHSFLDAVKDTWGHIIKVRACLLSLLHAQLLIIPGPS